MAQSNTTSGFFLKNSPSVLSPSSLFTLGCNCERKSLARHSLLCSIRQLYHKVRLPFPRPVSLQNGCLTPVPGSGTTYWNMDIVQQALYKELNKDTQNWSNLLMETKQIALSCLVTNNSSQKISTMSINVNDSHTAPAQFHREYYCSFPKKKLHM